MSELLEPTSLALSSNPWESIALPLNHHLPPARKVPTQPEVSIFVARCLYLTTLLGDSQSQSQASPPDGEIKPQSVISSAGGEQLSCCPLAVMGTQWEKCPTQVAGPPAPPVLPQWHLAVLPEGHCMAAGEAQPGISWVKPLPALGQGCSAQALSAFAESASRCSFNVREGKTSLCVPVL